jgi:hypothetical protein
VAISLLEELLRPYNQLEQLGSQPQQRWQWEQLWQLLGLLEQQCDLLIDFWLASMWLGGKIKIDSLCIVVALFDTCAWQSTGGFLIVEKKNKSCCQRVPMEMGV